MGNIRAPALQNLSYESFGLPRKRIRTGENASINALSKEPRKYLYQFDDKSDEIFKGNLFISIFIFFVNICKYKLENDYYNISCIIFFTSLLISHRFKKILNHHKK